MIEEIIRRLAEHTGQHDTEHSIALIPAGWSSVDRVEIELRGRGEISRFLAKVARLPPASGLVQHEAQILRKLRDMQVKDVPEIVLDGSCGGRAFFVERFIEGVRLKDAAFSEAEKVLVRLDWMKGFYSKTLGDSIEPGELLQRAEKAREYAKEFTDLTDAMAVLEKCKPDDRIPSVCWHGDPYSVNFLSTRDGLVAVDFGFSGFGEPPADPHVLAPPATLMEYAERLDVLSVLAGVNPFFLAIYGNLIHIGEHLRMQRELEENLLLVNRLREFPLRELGNIADLVECYHQLKA